MHFVILEVWCQRWSQDSSVTMQNCKSLEEISCDENATEGRLELLEIILFEF